MGTLLLASSAAAPSVFADATARDGSYAPKGPADSCGHGGELVDGASLEDVTQDRDVVEKILDLTDFVEVLERKADWFGLGREAGDGDKAREPDEHREDLERDHNAPLVEPRMLPGVLRDEQIQYRAQRPHALDNWV